MVKLNWDDPSEKSYETGIDRGVLYINNLAIPWVGLISMNTSNSGSVTPYYLDGQKYLNIAETEDFKAVLTAYGSPYEFGLCSGVCEIHNGLFASQQPKQAFGLSYRTFIGSASHNNLLDYKIHLVYNALAVTSDIEAQTRSETPTAQEFSWDIYTIPESLGGNNQTAHLTVDSRKTPTKLLARLEEILYGTTSEDGRIPLPSELVELFGSIGPLEHANLVYSPSSRNTTTTVEVRRNLCLDPHTNVTVRWRAAGNLFSVVDEGLPAMDCLENALGGTLYADPSNNFYLADYDVVVGDKFTFSAEVKAANSNSTPKLRCMVYNGANIVGTQYGNAVTLTPEDGWHRLTHTVEVSDLGTNGYFRFLIWPGEIDLPEGHGFRFRRFIVEKNTSGDFFGGTESPSDDFTAAWVGSVNNSQTILSAPRSTRYLSSGGRISYYSTTKDGLAVQNRQSSANWFLSVPAELAAFGSEWTYLAEAELVGPGSVEVLPYFSANSNLTNLGVVSEQTPFRSVGLFTSDQGVPTITAFRIAPMLSSQTLYLRFAVVSGHHPNLTYFDGQTPNVPGIVYEWTGEANNSTSNKFSWH